MSQETIHNVPLEQVSVAPQVRQDLDEPSLRGMALSLKEVGQLQPILVRREGDRLIVVDGERRWHAAKLAGLNMIAAIIEDRELTGGIIPLIQVSSNSHRKNLNPIELAHGINQLMAESGCTAAEAAHKLGFSAPAVSRHLSLLSLQPEVLQMVKSGAITASTAYKLAQADRAKQSELARKITEGKLTREQVTNLVRQSKAPSQQQGTSPLKRYQFDIGEKRSVSICCEGLTIDMAIECVEELARKLRRLRRRGVDLGGSKKILRSENRENKQKVLPGNESTN